MTDSAFRAMSVEEYLRTEESSSVKHEYVNGFAYSLHGYGPLHAQAGASDAHATIAGNIFAALRLLARKRGCFAYAADMRVTSADRRTYYYPDVLVTCEPREDDAKFKAEPCILVEVIPEHEFRNGNYAAYTALASLQTYLLVEQGERRVYAYQRGETGWELREYSGEEAVPLPCLDAELTLGDIYEDVR
jgi:Uma2 family endonuclease